MLLLYASSKQRRRVSAPDVVIVDNSWPILPVVSERVPEVRGVGLCHSGNFGEENEAGRECSGDEGFAYQSGVPIRL
jgi:hypothetical protein